MFEDSEGEDDVDEELTAEVELRNYFSISIGHFETLLLWWKAHEYLFPRLSAIARRIHSTPPSESSVERLFSKTGVVMGPNRSALAPETLNNIVVLGGHVADHQMYPNEQFINEKNMAELQIQ